MSSYSIEIRSNKNPSHYSCGETAYFFPLVIKDEFHCFEGKIEWILRRDNETELSRGFISASRKGSGVEGTLDQPGFLECEFILKPSDGNEASAKYGVAYEAHKIAPSTEMPQDYHEFWNSQLERLAQIPIKHTEKIIEDDAIQLLDVQIDCVDNIPTSGYLARPKNAPEKSCPALLFCQGAGVRSAHFHAPFENALSGIISMNINAHGLPNGRDNSYYESLSTGELADYRIRGFDGPPENAYFTNMFLRVRRALDFLCNDPLWDGKNLWLNGTSQGAMQTFAGAYLDKRVTALAAGVPAGSDLTGNVIGRVTGWPRPDSIFQDNPEKRDQVLDTVRYFDNVNFAKNINIPGIFSVGFVDGTCKPSSVYAVYNAYAGKKEIIDKNRMAHEGPRDIEEAFIAYLLNHKK
ncbi:MAG: hypothetical protein COA79_14000 [Planctomycetota bacterium]|nr:MAG: hypothetical protein COA79_14000 [Planctomycetota bacterium]